MFRWLAISLCFGPALAADIAPSLPDVIEQVRGSYRSADAMRLMRDVYASDRYFTFPRFQATARYLKKRMQEAGLSSVELVEAPADGVTQVGYWTMPLAWDVRSARLEILDETVPAASRVLAEYDKVPSSLGMDETVTYASNRAQFCMPNEHGSGAAPHRRRVFWPNGHEQDWRKSLRADARPRSSSVAQD